jgi:hypothetical protein
MSDVLKPVKAVKVASFSAESLRALNLSEIGNLARKDWLRPYFGAVPYLQALCELDTINDSYGCDPARQIVGYFLGNAQSWKGPNAKLIKAELNRRLKARAA